MAGGRPTAFKEEFVEQVSKLCALGATDPEIADFFALMPTEDDWLYACLLLIRQDRKGGVALRKARRSTYSKGRRAANPNVRLRDAVAARIWAALKGRSDGALFSRLGYSLEDLQGHLKGLFTEGMSWDNYGKWHVDHIKPCALFDQFDPEQFEKCWRLGNLQPLWARDNCVKGAKYAGA